MFAHMILPILASVLLCISTATASVESVLPEKNEPASPAVEEVKDPIPSMSEILAAGQYFDIALIRYLGVTEFEEWLRLNPSGTIIDVMDHFDLTLEDLQQVVIPRIYDLCVDYVSKHS